MPTASHSTHTSTKASALPLAAEHKHQGMYPLLAAILLVLACILVINGVFLYARFNDKDTGFPTHILTSEQSAHTAALDFKINNVALNNATDYAFTLPDDETMLVLNVTITNRSDASQRLTPVNQFYVSARFGSPSPMHPSMYLKDWLAAATLKPGQTARGNISFGVPKSATDLYLYVDTGWNNQTPVVFDVLK